MYWHCARRTTLKSEPLLTGCLIIIKRDITGLAGLLPAGLVRLPAVALSSRLCPYNGITCGQSICDVRVETAYGSVSKCIEEGRGQVEGRNGFDEHQEMEQNKGTECPNSQRPGNNNTKSHGPFCRPLFLHLWV